MMKKESNTPRFGPCGDPPLAAPLVPLDAWQDWSRGKGQHLYVPPELQDFRRGVWCADHCHEPQSVPIEGPFGGHDYMQYCARVGRYLVVMAEPRHYMLYLATRAGRILRALRVSGMDPLEGDERHWEKQARALATAELAVRTLKERHVFGRRSTTGDAWLRRQLAGLERTEA